MVRIGASLMTTHAFEPITRAAAAQILGISLGTLDKHVRDGDLPPPRPLGNGRQLYWLPEQFFACLRRGLQPPNRRDSGDQQPLNKATPPRERRTSGSAKRKDGYTAADRTIRRTNARVKKMNS